MSFKNPQYNLDKIGNLLVQFHPDSPPHSREHSPQRTDDLHCYVHHTKYSSSQQVFVAPCDIIELTNQAKNNRATKIGYWSTRRGKSEREWETIVPEYSSGFAAYPSMIS